MAINFPSSPTNGQQYTSGNTTWTYDSTQGKWKGTRTAASVASATAPSNPSPGQLWFDTDTGELYVWYEDGTSNQWVEVGSFSDIAILDEDTLVSNSDTAVPTQQSVKAYVDRQHAPQTSQALTSGSSKDFTGIPSWVNKITIVIAGMSTNGTDQVWLRLGTSGGIVSSGYTGSCTTGSGTTAALRTAEWCISSSVAAADVRTGILTLARITGNQWVLSGYLGVGDASGSGRLSAGTVTLSDVLTQLRIMTAGTDLFDAGTVNISYE